MPATSIRFPNRQASPATHLAPLVAFLSVGLVFVTLQTGAVQFLPLPQLIANNRLSRPVQTRPIDLGQMKLEDHDIACKLILENHANHPIKVVGLKKSCQCLLMDDILFREIPRQGTETITLKLRPTKPGAFHQRVLFYLDSPQQPFVAANIFADFLEDRK